jgi:hypothetical protein
MGELASTTHQILTSSACTSVLFSYTNWSYFSELVQWLWPTLIQQELDTLKDQFNNHVVRKDRGKKLPSGVSPNIAYTLYKEYGGENCLQPIDPNFVKSLMEGIGGEDLIRFVSVEYAAHAQAVFETLGFVALSFHNVWLIFSAMMPIMYPL